MVVSVSAGLRSKLDTAVLALQRRVVCGSLTCTKLSLEILRELLVSSRFASPSELLEGVRGVGTELLEAAPHELCIGNVTRRVLFLVREDLARLLVGMESTNSSFNNMSLNSSRTDESSHASSSKSLLNAVLPASKEGIALSAEEETESSLSKRMNSLRQTVVHSINELYDELDNLFEPISEQAQEHIHADERIFTMGYSPLVESFLRSAAKKRHFNVFIAEGGPLLEGVKLANSLAKIPNISVTLVPDCNIYPLMSRVNKVVLSPHAVLADGGLIASSGSELVAVAAKDFSVPLICLATTFMLSPVFAHNHEEVLGQLLSPALVIDYDAAVNADRAEVIVSAYDYVPPQYIDTFITNSGTVQPSYVYRLLGEYYHASDYDLNLKQQQ